MTAASITLDYVDPRDLKPHEDILKNRLAETIISIRETRSVVPIIVDHRTLLIIDGHHRWEALSALGHKRIPIYYVDYLDPRISVGIWYRKLTLNSVSKLYLKSMESEGDVCIQIESKICSRSHFEAYWKLELIEQSLRRFGVQVERNPSEGYKPPNLSKEIILKIASKETRLPPKSSRHLYDFIIPKDRVKLQ
ncbi:MULTISPECIES: ParB N-terminal domain-containing protein [Metallosphaera]|uniref:ParB N-terminal domain-containing protein n=1 Tax=Metallosphaera TaxID=41980 RepID=UPI001F05DC9E|nr:ParB N-terminal domain-containing protein [Metallosphaera sedula]MCH1770614.1 ParB N-terminal domain-containing protein [Metallosphaera sedula]MCP6728812.1 ParB N-terminal domain-containing protein [Metallosphaera sedula]